MAPSDSKCYVPRALEGDSDEEEQGRLDIDRLEKESRTIRAGHHPHPKHPHQYEADVRHHVIKVRDAEKRASVRK
jgi:hypothetical protein